MDGFTIIDAVVAVVIIVSAILAYSRGLMRETLSILGWIAAAVIAFMFAHKVEPMVQEIPWLGEKLAGSCELSIIAAFAAVFAVALVIVSLFTPLFSGMIRRSVLGGLDQGLGFLFGALRGILLVAVAFVVYERVITNQAVALVDNSRSAKIFSSVQTEIDDQIPTDAPGWILARYEQLVGTCGVIKQEGASTGAVGG